MALASLLLFLVGAYTGIGVDHQGHILIPSVLCLGVTPALYFCGRRYVRTAVLVPTLALVALVVVQILLCWFFNVADPGEMTRAGVNLFYSLFVGYGFYVAAVGYGPRRFRRLMGGVAIFLLLGAAMEVWLHLTPSLLPIRLSLYGDHAYLNDVRDELLYGRARPSLLAIEPSHLGLFTLAFLTAWLATARRMARKLDSALYWLGVAWAIYFVRSPTLVLSLPLYFIVVRMRREAEQPYDRPKRTRRRRILLGVAVFAGMIGGTLALGPIGAATGNGVLQNVSVFERLIGPAAVTERVLVEHPFIGVGLGADISLTPLAHDVYGKVWRGGWDEFLEADARYLITNSFFLHWIYWGAAFGTLVGLLYLAQLRAMGVPDPVFVALSGCVMWFTLGGYVTVQSWIIVYTFGAACTCRYLDASDPVQLLRPRQVRTVRMARQVRLERDGA